jgi:hypothetical protein
MEPEDLILLLQQQQQQQKYAISYSVVQSPP